MFNIINFRNEYTVSFNGRKARYEIFISCYSWFKIYIFVIKLRYQ